MSLIAETRLRYPDLRGKALLARWWQQLESLCDLLADQDPKEQLSFRSRPDHWR